MKPAAEWDVIDGEAATTQGLLTGYTAVIAVILPIAVLIGALIGILLFHGFGLIGLIPAVLEAVLLYVLGVLSVFIAGLIINAFATTFGGTSNAVQAMKVAAYGTTAYFLSGIIYFIPIVGWLAVLAGFGYSCYLVHLGISKLMKPPADKAVVYSLVSILVSSVVNSILLWIAFVIVGVITLAIGAAAITGGAMAIR